jgi:hypothetical protein
VPATLTVTPRGRALRGPEAVRQASDRLTALDAGVHARELARLLCFTCGSPSHHHTVQRLGPQSPLTAPQPPARGASPAQTDPADARLQRVRRSYPGGDTVRLSRFCRTSRPTVDRWLARVEAAPVAGLIARKRGPQSPRPVWLPVRVAGSHLPKRHPDAGEFRLWRLLARPDLAGRTVGRMMALQKPVSDDLPPGRTTGPQLPPQPPPDNARPPHACWCLDGRLLDCALEGGRWCSLISLDGSSRPRLAGAVAPAEASWRVLMVLSTACRHSGGPEPLISDRGGAFTSQAVEAGLAR